MVSVIKWFVSFNIKICRFLERQHPNFFVGARSYGADLKEEIKKDIRTRQPSKIVEVGGIDRPLIQKSTEYEYIGVDIEVKDTCYEIYDKFYVQSIERELDITCGLIISTTLLEHVPNNKLSLRTIYCALEENGLMLHYVPSKFHFYSIILRLVGPFMQKIIIKYLRPHAIDVTGYPAFFDHCSPSAMQRLCKDTGFKEIEIIPYYRATDYFAFFVPFFVTVALFENIFELLNIKSFASGFILKARKSQK